MAHFVVGQRWISETEPELGLGTVISFEHHRVTVLFIASSERRTYAADNAPLTRVRFTRGDWVESVDGLRLRVREVTETGGLLTYLGQGGDGEPARLDELELNHYMQFNKPQDRLFTGQIDPPALFKLRVRTLQKLGELEQSPVQGLCGARASLIPHQLYIAHEVASRHAPRVLLADEVGLGKTIEAGLILHHQLLTGRAERVLILVPEPLLHQWLVEMRRRFNLRFSLFDDERYYQHESGNPFQGGQLVLCSLEFFHDEPKRRQEALTAGWDLCIVDEAHHLEWSEENPSEDYAFVEDLSRAVPGLLLLTATPEQLGKYSHFARLRLLDPDRFFSYEGFLAEEQGYEPLARLLEHLLESKPLDASHWQQLKLVVANDRAEELLSQLDDPHTAAEAKEGLIRLVLDRHGTGRILFRNTRATVKGFPQRQVIATPLPCPAVYADANPHDGRLEGLLFPETRRRKAGEAGAVWWRQDPRVRWLLDILNRIKPAKALVICAQWQTAVDLEEAMRVLGGIGAAVFHEGLSIVARDRAAAWFADDEDGAQVLICSEIGSEGRNFQFAHHLVLFDLPLFPDQLDQRIGRLDRIGQSETIKIHVSFMEDTPQALLYRWYGEALNAFDRPNPAGSAVFARLRTDLEALLHQPGHARCDELIAKAKRMNAEALAELHQGRDRLLELNSCRRQEADCLVGQINQAESAGDLWPYLEEVFEVYGVNVEEHSADCHILLPGDHIRVPNFPELPEDGVTVTCKREIGLAREDMLFLTWEHPMVRGAMDLTLNNAHGNSAFTVVRHDGLDAGQLLLECVYLVECPAPRHLGAGRYLPQSVIRVLLDTQMQESSPALIGQWHEISMPFDQEEVANLLRGQRQLIERMIRQAGKLANKHLPGIVQLASERMLANATQELKRLAALKKVNPYVRQEELNQVKANTLELHGHLEAAQLRLDALRVILSA